MNGRGGEKRQRGRCGSFRRAASRSELHGSCGHRRRLYRSRRLSYIAVRVQIVVPLVQGDFYECEPTNRSQEYIMICTCKMLTTRLSDIVSRYNKQLSAAKCKNYDDNTHAQEKATGLKSKITHNWYNDTLIAERHTFEQNSYRILTQTHLLHFFDWSSKFKKPSLNIPPIKD
uniref:Uncharacterized protein n=1 Tax=Romanomermis culicivorax TaxID=13658 RepID=A0A915I9Q9_ROMCU